MVCTGLRTSFIILGFKQSLTILNNCHESACTHPYIGRQKSQQNWLAKKPTKHSTNEKQYFLFCIFIHFIHLFHSCISLFLFLVYKTHFDIFTIFSEIICFGILFSVYSQFSKTHYDTFTNL